MCVAEHEGPESQSVGTLARTMACAPKVSYVLKAAGTPMINPLPFNSCDKSTLLPGVLSKSSREGIESPALTILKRV